jgi:nucleotidyltransferase AbiEii toxin of type IV toxin-antitoxin system
MSAAFTPHLEILPPAQKRLWPELATTPSTFTLYGGTGIALRLGHRASVDFDFFSWAPFVPMNLMNQVPYLATGTVVQSSANTLTMTVDRGGPVQLSFFGGLNLGQVAPAEVVSGPEFKVASLIDLAGMKAAVVTQRAEVRDYVDIHCLMTRAGMTLSDMLAAAAVIYGPQFNPLISLKAIAYHDDPTLAELPATVRDDLRRAVAATDPNRLPILAAFRNRGDGP